MRKEGSSIRLWRGWRQGIFFLFFFLTGSNLLKAQLKPLVDVTISPGVPVRFAAEYGEVAEGIEFSKFGDVKGSFPIGFSFSFYGRNYTRFWVGANGWINFDSISAPKGKQCQAFHLPSLNNPNVPLACILGPIQDLDPSGAGGPFVFYRTVNKGGRKKLVVMWCQCPVFSCPDSTSTVQIVLNEGSNAIENHIYKKPFVCNITGPDPNATQGIQDLTGTYDTVVPGRNAQVWNVIPSMKEGWLYTPTSNTSYNVTPINYQFVPISPPDKISFRWYEGSDPEPVSYDSILIVAPNETTTYKVVVTLCNGEEFADTVTVTVKPPVPTGFTPNGDGVNDLFEIEGTPVDPITLYNLRIYDRWGQAVFSSDKITDLWNGKRNNTGEDCPDGTYVWVIYYEKSDKTKVTNKGSITLVR